MDNLRHERLSECGPLNCVFLSINRNDPKYSNFKQAERMFENITGKPASLMTDEQYKEINDRCKYMALNYLDERVSLLDRRELLSDNRILHIVVGWMLGFYLIWNLALWSVDLGQSEQSYSKQQIIERVKRWE